MSNLNNVYTSCPGLMSDGRAQRTDYKSHNEVLKEMKGTIEQSYSFREKLQGSGLRDLEAGVRFNMCGAIPAGDIILPTEMNLNINKSGSYLDAFGPLSKNTFFIKPVEPQVVSTQPTLPVPVMAPIIPPMPTTTAAPTPMPTTMSNIIPPMPTTMAPMMMAPMPTTMAPMMMPTTMAPMMMPTTMAPMMPTTMAPMMPTTMAPTMAI